MGYTSTGGTKGRGSFNSTPATQSDFNQVLTLLSTYGNIMVDTTTVRNALSGAKLYNGLHFFDTTLGKLLVYNGSGWVVAWAPATALGSVTPVAGAGFTLSNNNLYTRDGWLLGSIDWVKNSGTLAHADVVMTLPAGARPSTEYIVDGNMGPSPSQIQPLNVTTGGVVSALVPVAGRTGGTIKFAMPIPS